MNRYGTPQSSDTAANSAHARPSIRSTPARYGRRRRESTSRQGVAEVDGGCPVMSVPAAPPTPTTMPAASRHAVTPARRRAGHGGGGRRRHRGRVHPGRWPRGASGRRPGGAGPASTARTATTAGRPGGGRAADRDTGIACVASSVNSPGISGRDRRRRRLDVVGKRVTRAVGSRLAHGCPFTRRDRHPVHRTGPGVALAPPGAAHPPSAELGTHGGGRKVRQQTCSASHRLGRPEHDQR